jgi:acid phosphatase class B
LRFREFAAECIELAQTASSPEKHALYLKMASVWHQMAQRWEKVSD